MQRELRSDLFLAKAEESLMSAVSDLAAARYNSCANRCYYACFQAAIAALLHAGIVPRGRDAGWSHSFVQAQFAETLVTRRKRYGASLRDTLPRLVALRIKADYEPGTVSAKQARRALERAREFVGAVREGNDLV